MPELGNKVITDLWERLSVAQQKFLNEWSFSLGLSVSEGLGGRPLCCGRSKRRRNLSAKLNRARRAWQNSCLQAVSLDVWGEIHWIRASMTSRKKIMAFLSTLAWQ